MAVAWKPLCLMGGDLEQRQAAVKGKPIFYRGPDRVNHFQQIPL